MKLSPKSYTRVFFEKDKEVALTQWNEVLKRVSDQDEVIVISLGAMATNVILGRKERLSRIHGQEFQLNLQSSAKETKLVVFPVFHPDILQINPNMKRSAWLDLQKVMKRL
jgi:uracil-DNA glycosylase family 4